MPVAFLDFLAVFFGESDVLLFRNVLFILFYKFLLFFHFPADTKVLLFIFDDFHKTPKLIHPYLVALIYFLQLLYYHNLSICQCTFVLIYFLFDLFIDGKFLFELSFYLIDHCLFWESIWLFQSDFNLSLVSSFLFWWLKRLYVSKSCFWPIEAFFLCQRLLVTRIWHFRIINHSKQDEKKTGTFIGKIMNKILQYQF